MKHFFSLTLFRGERGNTQWNPVLLKKLHELVTDKSNIGWSEVATEMTAQFAQYHYTFTSENTRYAYLQKKK